LSVDITFALQTPKETCARSNFNFPRADQPVLAHSNKEVVCCNTLLNALQYTATHCNTLQHTATQMNPRGLVPVLKHGNKVVVESDDIIKYIDAHIGTSAELSQVVRYK